MLSVEKLICEGHLLRSWYGDPYKSPSSVDDHNGYRGGDHTHNRVLRRVARLQQVDAFASHFRR